MKIIYIKLLTEALIVIAKSWKQSKVPYIGKLWYIHTMEHYAAIKKNKEDLYVSICSDFQETILSLKSKTQKSA